MRLLLTIVVMMLCCKAMAQPWPRNYLQGAVNAQVVETMAASLDGWRSERRKELFAKVAALPDSTKATLLQQANTANNYNWPSVKATDFLRYRLDGNRSVFEKSLLERRKMIRFLMLGELVEQKGKFLPQLMNGIWLTCEESTWNLPAHLYEQKAGLDLPDVTEQPIDLFVGEAGAMIAYLHFLFADSIRKSSPVLAARMLYELDKRLVQPFLHGRDFGWMAFHGERANNWNIWINNNLLTTAAYAVQNKDDFKKLVLKSVRSADQFINWYPEDGGIDEGPTYWQHAGARLMEYLHTLKMLSGGAVDFQKNQLLNNIGSFIYKSYIGGNYFINPADAHLRMQTLNPASVYRAGSYFNDTTLQQFAAHYFYIKKASLFDDLQFVTSGIELLDSYTTISNTKPAIPKARSYWLPQLQMLTARQQAGSATGLFLFIQGGHNAESHNHNDVGNFTIYVDGQPIIGDAGAGVYNKETFGPNRYSIWNMQSSWHNCPTINGKQQGAGAAYKATDVQYKEAGASLRLSMNIAAAYPAEASVTTWQRQWVFNRSKGFIELSESYLLTQTNDSTTINFLTPVPPVQQGNAIRLQKEGRSGLVIQYNPQQFHFLVEEKKLEDERLTDNWQQDRLYRIILKKKQQLKKDKHSIRFVLLPGSNGLAVK